MGGIFRGRPLQSPFGLGVIAALVTTGLGGAWLQLQAGSTNLLLTAFNKSDQRCVTIATDPNPPLNVRSSPVVAPDNVIGQLSNGTSLTVADENQGWLRITAPITGWVYKELTVTTCGNVTHSTTSSPANPDRGIALLGEATIQYHSGNLKGAIALLKTVPQGSLSYPQAQAALQAWPQSWDVAESRFYDAQTSLREGRWQDVLNQVQQFPDIRYWRQKLTPLVREAIRQKQAASQPESPAERPEGQ